MKKFFFSTISVSMISSLLFSSCQKELNSQANIETHKTSLNTQDKTESELNQSAKVLNSLSIGLVAYYPFSGNANDYSGNKLNGTVYGPKLIDDRFKHKNNAYSFNGINNYIEIADAPILNFNANTQSISFWIKIPQIPHPAYLEGIIDKYNQNLSVESNGNAGTGFLVHFASDGSIFYSIKNGLDHNWGDCRIYPSNFCTNQYFHILFTNDGHLLNGYVNGVKVSESEIPSGTAIGATNFSLLIGKDRETYAGIPMDYFNGVIDDLRIYNRALNSNEIAYLATH
jgi:hypothetical protein